MSAPQLVDVILEAYAARPEIKEYFEYFLNPDVSRLFVKQMKEVNKELNRSKYRYSKARVSVINKAIKDFAAYNPGDDRIVNFIVSVIYNLAETEISVDFTDTHWSLVSKLVKQALATADNAGIIDRAVEPLSHFIYNYNDNVVATIGFRCAVKDASLEYNTSRALDPGKKKR